MDVTYEIIDEIGKGSFSTVYRVRSSATGSVYAAKVARGPKQEALLRHEADIHSRLTHPNILQFISSFSSASCGRTEIRPLTQGERGDCSVIILELCEGRTLESYVKEAQPISRIREWGSAIGSGLLYMKEQGIVHRDIKPENVLFCADGVKIADFGLAALESDLLGMAGSAGGGHAGTAYYMPLEAFSNIYSYFTDIFAFGVILFQLYTGNRPYRARDVQSLIQRLTRPVPVVSGNRTSRDAGLETLILSMIERNTNRRPTIEQVLQNPFFDELLGVVPMDMDEPVISLDDFRAAKADFGNGTREQFYVFLANKRPNQPPLSMKAFTDLWTRLAAN